MVLPSTSDTTMMRNNNAKKRLFASAFALSLGTMVTIAGNVDTDQTADSLSLPDVFLDEVVVTATRTPKLLKNVPIQTRLITSADIAKVDATNVQDLLQQEMPGVEFSYAMNQQTHLNFAGFGGQSVLFLVDGERLSGEAMDDVDFNRLVTTNVDHIEIVKGAASALYGSNAGGGVINIITKDGGKKWILNVNGRYAPRHNEQRYGGAFGFNSKYVSNMLTANYSGIDNFSVYSATGNVARVFSEVYGNKNINIKEQLTVRPMQGLKFVARLGYYYNRMNRTTQLDWHYRDYTGGLHGVWEINKDNNVELSYSFDQYDKSNYYIDNHLDVRNYSNVQNSVRALYNHSFSDVGVLTAGADYMHDYLYNSKLQDYKRSQDSFDMFAQMDWIINRKWELVGALRYDYFSDKKNSHVTPKINACFKPRHNMAVRLGYGMGFRAPSLKEMYYDFDMAGIWIVKGNPDLKPEISHNFNASFEWSKSVYNVTVSAYYNRVVDKLANGVPYALPDDPKQLYLDYVNLDNYSVYGFDVTLFARWHNGIGAKLSYAFTKENLAKDKDGNVINNQYVPARAHSLTARIDYDKQFSECYGFNWSLNGRVLSGVDNIEYKDYYDISKGTALVRYPAYTLWKLSFVQRFTKQQAVKLTLTLDNLFNYKPKYYYYNAPLTDGINFLVGVAVDIDKFFD